MEPMLNFESLMENINASPLDAPGKVTLLTTITNRITNKAGIINLLAFSIPRTPKKQISAVIIINRKCQNTGSTGELMKAVKSSGAW